MVHAMAPKANIVLITTPSGGNNGTEDQEFADFMEGVQDAAKMTGVVGVSLSYGDTEGNVGSSAVVSLNNQYLATGAAANVAVTVSTGDSSSPGYPATSPNVVAVGATSLFVSSAQGRYFYETAWGGLSGDGAGGGGPSDNFAAPTFQSGNGVTLSSNRTIPDISMVGDPVTGVSVYDTWDDGGGSPWNEVGGTSAAAPLAQGVIALAQQERIAAGLPILNSVEIDTAFYEAYNSPAYLTYFHDIKIGNNSDPSAGITGYQATTGYDEATGIGSPIANTLVPYLAKYVIGT
jgi:subtilase family serine protease